MDKFRALGKPVSNIIVFGLLCLTFHVPAANAALIGTDTVVIGAQNQATRARIENLLNREEVKNRLAESGVSVTEVQARVDSLTDAEAETLAANLDQLPAGGSTLGVVLFVFVVLIITDLLGFTDIFPFVKKPAKR